jgi:hypothetical protein
MGEKTGEKSAQQVVTTLDDNAMLVGMEKCLIKDNFPLSVY